MQCRGGVLPIAGADLAAEVFDRYFGDEPPFANSRLRKSEFPDATSLVLLERFAREHDTYGVVASGDAAWTAFADASDRLYAVASIADLATLFAATSAHATALKTKLLTAMNDATSVLRARLDDALARHVAEAEWDTGRLVSGSGRLEAEVVEVELDGYHWDGALIDVWPIEDEPMAWVIEVVASVRAIVHVEVNFHVWDSIDREEMSIGYNTVSLPTEVEITAYLNCGDVELAAEIEEWQVEPEIARGRYSLGEVEVDPDFRDRN